jgi:hypothetical protein
MGTLSKTGNPGLGCSLATCGNSGFGSLSGDWGMSKVRKRRRAKSSKACSQGTRGSTSFRERELRRFFNMEIFDTTINLSS